MSLTLSVIIATKDRLQALTECLESLQRQTVPPQTVIIIDASANKKAEVTAKRILEKENINLVYKNSKPGLTYQRNLGIRQNPNELVLFIDDDVILDSNYIKEIKSIFLNDPAGKIGGVTGRIQPGKQKSILSILIRKIFCLSEPGRGEVKKSFANNSIHPRYVDEMFEVQWLSGCNQCYRKEVFNDFLFDENLASYAYMEDVDFSFRVGQKYKLIFIPHARLVHNIQVSHDTRLRKREKQRMFMLNLYYLFKKNQSQTLTYKFCHYWSYIGYLLRGLLLERSFAFTMGTVQGIMMNLSGKNPLMKLLREK